MARVYKATIRCSDQDGVLIEPGLHYQTDLSAGGSEPDPDDVASAIWNHVGANFEQATSSLVTIHELVVAEQVLKPAIGVAGAHTVAAPGLIFTSDTKMPTELCPLLLWHTNVHSRSARGHTFMPPVYSSTEMAATGIVNTTLLAQLQAFVNAAITIFAVGTTPFETTIRPVVYSRTRHARGETPFAFNVSGGTVKPNVTWLRSRGSAP